ncbi:MAG: extracellular solute-binding protein [Anaerolineae bacterium]|nr:extracellular solute-binding protein [Anaerolineae bacterium]
MSKRLSRRDFLRLSGTSAAALASGFHMPGLLRAAPSLQDVVRISFGGWGGTAEDEGVRAAIEVFQQEMPGIAVEWQHTPDAGEYNRVLLTNFAAGTTPDTSFIISDAYETYRSQGMLLDITDQIAADPLLGQPDYFMPQEAFRCADSNGRWHGIGSCWVAHHIYYNQAAFDEIGVAPPGFADDEIWDWDSFVNVCKQLTVDSAGRHPDDAGFDPDDIQRWAVDWPLWWMPIAAAVHSNGGAYFADGKVALDTPEALEALTRLYELIYVHHVAPRSASMADLGMSNTQMVDNGRLAMAVDGSWALSWMNPSLVTVPLGTGALPKMKQPATVMQAHFHSALANTQHPEEAWQWVRFLSTPFYQTQFLKIGLWLPSQTALTTEEGLATWITEGIHPANYRQFVSEYLPTYGVSVRIPSGYLEAASSFIDPAVQAIAGGTPPADVIPEAVRQANDIIAMAAI